VRKYSESYIRRKYYEAELIGIQVAKHVSKIFGNSDPKQSQQSQQSQQQYSRDPKIGEYGVSNTGRVYKKVSIDELMQTVRSSRVST
jgi:hypothetical protein